MPRFISGKYGGNQHRDSCACIPGTATCNYDCGGSSGRHCDNDDDCASNGTQPYCFIKGTKIKLSDGTERNIENIKIGDKILSYNLETKQSEEDIVDRIDSPIHNNMIVVKWEHTTNTNTFDHPYYSVVKNDWVSYKPELTLINYDIDIQQLVVGDIGLFINENGDIIESKLLSVEEINETTKTYNLTIVRNNNNYFANGMLVHNKGSGYYPPAGEIGRGWGGRRRGGKIFKRGNFQSGGHIHIGNNGGECPKGYYMGNKGVCEPGNSQSNRRNHKIIGNITSGTLYDRNTGGTWWNITNGCPGVSCPCDGGWSASCDCSGSSISCPECTCVTERGELVYRKGGIPGFEDEIQRDRGRHKRRRDWRNRGGGRGWRKGGQTIGRYARGGWIPDQPYDPCPNECQNMFDCMDGWYCFQAGSCSFCLPHEGGGYGGRGKWHGTDPPIGGGRSGWGSRGRRGGRIKKGRRR